MKKSILFGALALAVSGIAVADDYPRGIDGGLLQAAGQPCWKTPYFKADPTVTPAEDLVYCRDAHWETITSKSFVTERDYVTIGAFFDTNDSTITGLQGEELLQVLDKFNSPTPGSLEIDLIMGETDDRGDAGYNLRLGSRRATALFDLLSDAGYTARAIGSFGETNATMPGDQPLYRTATATGTADVVRIVIVEETILVIDTK